METRFGETLRDAASGMPSPLKSPPTMVWDATEAARDCDTAGPPAPAQDLVAGLRGKYCGSGSALFPSRTAYAALPAKTRARVERAPPTEKVSFGRPPQTRLGGAA